MSRQNKVNPDHYRIAGRLTPDDLARERQKQNMLRTGVRQESDSSRYAPPAIREAAASGTPDAALANDNVRAAALSKKSARLHATTKPGATKRTKGTVRNRDEVQGTARSVKGRVRQAAKPSRKNRAARR
jgi:hypothetical protein